MNLTFSELESKTLEELTEMARQAEIPECEELSKQELINRLLQISAEQGGGLFCRVFWK